MFDPLSEGSSEFTSVLRTDGNWDVFLDGDLAYSDLTDMGLIDFARAFRDSNPEYLAPADAGE